MLNKAIVAIEEDLMHDLLTGTVRGPTPPVLPLPKGRDVLSDFGGSAFDVDFRTPS